MIKTMFLLEVLPLLLLLGLGTWEVKGEDAKTEKELLTTSGNVFDQAVPPEIFEKAQIEIKNLIGAFDKGQGGIQGFVSQENRNDPDWQPKSFIEASVNHLWTNYAAKHLDNDIFGAEWWIRFEHPGDKMFLHFDHDEKHFTREKEMAFPELMSIFYLSDVGAPTLIMDWEFDGFSKKKCPKDGYHETDECIKVNLTPDSPSDGLLVYPSENRYMFGNGSYFHGIVPITGEYASGGYEPRDHEKYKEYRVTLLVNYWKDYPSFKSRRRSDVRKGDLYYHPGFDVPWLTMQEDVDNFGRDKLRYLENTPMATKLNIFDNSEEVHENMRKLKMGPHLQNWNHYIKPRKIHLPDYQVYGRDCARLKWKPKYREGKSPEELKNSQNIQSSEAPPQPSEAVAPKESEQKKDHQEL